VHPTAYVHPTAVLIGDVIVGPRCYVGPLASLRGDFGRLILEEGAVSDDEIAWKSYGTRQYHDLNVRSMRTMREVEAFTEVEPGRQRIVFDEPHKPKQ
jgi:phenylacetic acid degradation protein